MSKKNSGLPYPGAYITPYPVEKESHYTNGVKINSLNEKMDKLLRSLLRVEGLLYDIKFGLKNGVWPND